MLLGCYTDVVLTKARFIQLYEERNENFAPSGTKNMRTVGKYALLLLIFLSSKSAFAEAMQTNLQGVILKNVRCSGGFICFNVSNRSTNSIKGYLRVTVFDADGDPIDSGGTKINVGPVSGLKTNIMTSCGTKYAFRIE